MERLKQTEVSPAMILGILIAVAVALLAGVYFLFIQPKMAADAAMRDFNTPEAQAKRDPDQRKTPEGLKKKIEELRAKQLHYNTGQARRHEN